MKNKKILRNTFLIGFAVFLLPASAYALSPGDTVEAGGQVIGIALQCDGVIISSLAEVDEETGSVSPAEQAGLRAGDRIIAADGRPIRCREDFLSVVSSLDGQAVPIRAVRNGEEHIFTVTPAQGNRGVWQLGLWLRDDIRGIGTVTFRDAATGFFGALGHGVELSETSGLVSAAAGTVSPAVVTDVVRGQRGAPGELCAGGECPGSLGELTRNTDCGIFGRCSPLPDSTPVILGAQSEIRPGPVTILSTVDDSGVRAFSGEILRISRTPGDRELTISVTDPELLRITGGIVQGMSGSPILQNGKLIGAVTHVLVSDPTKGYGISAENMLKAGTDVLPMAG